MNLKSFFLLIVHEICSTVEQIVLKKSADRLESHKFNRPRDYFIFIKKVLSMPTIWLAFVVIVAAWIFWFTVLANVELSMAMPIDSLQYIMILLASYFFLGERMHPIKITGVLFILVGITMVASS